LVVATSPASQLARNARTHVDQLGSKPVRTSVVAPPKLLLVEDQAYHPPLSLLLAGDSKPLTFNEQQEAQTKPLTLGLLEEDSQFLVISLGAVGPKTRDFNRDRVFKLIPPCSLLGILLGQVELI
jgi:hypothetical protein